MSKNSEVSQKQPNNCVSPVTLLPTKNVHQ